MFEKKKNETAISPESLAPEGGTGEATTPGGGCASGEGSARESLAMVYSPRQYWRDVYSPVEALDRGTLFAELDKPLTGVCVSGGGDCE
ncbi:MAG: spore coat associated protein CotJA [Clostridia bacterium]|nr:spore coat associated protein CotJA [Clostridia bacterium]